MFAQVTEIEVFPKTNDIIHLTEDAFILDAEYRSGNRLVAAVAEPIDVDEDYCMFIKENGEQCERPIPQDESQPWRCHHHS